jgi:hypothetical protein
LTDSIPIATVIRPKVVINRSKIISGPLAVYIVFYCVFMPQNGSKKTQNGIAKG